MSRAIPFKRKPTNLLLYCLYQPYKWLILFPLLLVSTLFFASLALVLVYLVNPKVASQIAGVLWARLNCFLTPIGVKVSGRSHVDKSQSYVIVSNHQSQYDIFVLYGWLDIDFKWVMKKELRKVPGIGVSCEKIGHVFIDRFNRQAAMASLEEAKGRIVHGTSIVFFPEGTRTKDGSLGRFKKGAFRMALELGLPILPITIKGTRDILPSGTLDLLPGRAELIFHAPIEVAGMKKENLDEMMARSRQVIASGLGEEEQV